MSHDGQKVDYTNEIKLSSEEDAPMTIAVDRKVSLVSLPSLLPGLLASTRSPERVLMSHRERTW